MTRVAEKTAHLDGPDGTRLFHRRFIPRRTRFQVVVSHGLGEHSGRYGHVVEALCPLGAGIWIHDHRGHGHSAGRRGHIRHFTDYVNDLQRVVERARSDPAGRLPLLLLGHSMGGLIALAFARRHPGRIDGLIVSSPLLGFYQPLSPATGAAIALLSRLWPGLPLPSRIDPAIISHDNATVAEYRQRVHHPITARWLGECQAEMAATRRAAASIPGPILMQLAGDDRLVSPRAAMTLFDSLTTGDKTLLHYPRLYHEIYNETPRDRAVVLEDLRRWVAARFP